ncbi:RluA family pseudouridine synthase [Candidatus Peregrinibacteria bacterium]|nr:RluA family pseudouridine synthase [Candidatus Peregrinibacteria bacterium]
MKTLYEDHFCAVLNKAAGVNVSELPYEFLVHRLDKETTGCLLIAKTADSLDLLQRQFKERTVQKVYLALVSGIPQHKHAIIDAPIGRNIAQRTKMGVSRIAKRREAQTEYRVLQTGNNAALLECIPKTGRTHQIRVHLKSIGHPIVGDTKYGSKDHAECMCLHAWKLSFGSPIGVRVHAEAPIPKEFQGILETKGIFIYDPSIRPSGYSG